MKRPSYKDAIFQLTFNEDCGWVNEPDWYPITAGMIATLFDVDIEKVREDVKKRSEKKP